jgi:adenylate kinase
MSGLRMVILGRQGAGKGTQATALSEHYGVPHISTGDMMRRAVKEGTTYGTLAKEYMDAGELVPDDITNGVVEERLSGRDTIRQGYLLDGFPRTVAQAEVLAAISEQHPLDVVVNLAVPTDVVVGRIAGRRVCDSCGTNYSPSRPPTQNWTCDVCGGDVVQRDDDTEEAVRRRLDLYERETAPVIAWYERQGLLATVDGMGTTDEVTRRLVDVVDARLANRSAEPAS